MLGGNSTSFFGGVKPEDLEKAIEQNNEAERVANRTKIERIADRVKGNPRYNGFPKVVSGADFKIRCSAIGDIMSNQTGKSNMQKWVEAKEKLDTLVAEKTDREAKIKGYKEDNEAKQEKTREKIKGYEETLEGADMNLAKNKKTEQTKANQEKYLEKLQVKYKEIEEEGAAKLFQINASLEMQRELESNLFQTKDEVQLSAGCKTFLRKWLKEAQTGRRRQVDTKYMYKGLEKEDEAIELYNRVVGTTGEKNDQRLYSDWVAGEYDLKPDGLDRVVDIKCSWDVETFPQFKNVPPSGQKTPNKKYWSQLNGYMHLLIENNMVNNIDDLHAELAYCLVDAPDDLIAREIRNRAYKLGEDKLPAEEEDKIFFNMNFQDIPESKKVKRYRFYPDFEFIERIKTRVEECRVEIDKMIAEENMLIEIKDVD